MLVRPCDVLWRRCTAVCQATRHSRSSVWVPRDGEGSYTTGKLRTVPAVSAGGILWSRKQVICNHYSSASRRIMWSVTLCFYLCQGGYVSLLFFVCLFVCFTGLCKITQPIFREFNGKVAHGPWKKPLDFGGNLDLEPVFFFRGIFTFLANY